MLVKYFSRWIGTATAGAQAGTEHSSSAASIEEGSGGLAPELDAASGRECSKAVAPPDVAAEAQRVERAWHQHLKQSRSAQSEVQNSENSANPADRQHSSSGGTSDIAANTPPTAASHPHGLQLQIEPVHMPQQATPSCSNEAPLATTHSSPQQLQPPLALLAYNLCKVFKGLHGKPDVKAVSGVSLAIQRNECFGLCGPSGGGKTTTLLMLQGGALPGCATAVLCICIYSWRPLKLSHKSDPNALCFLSLCSNLFLHH